MYKRFKWCISDRRSVSDRLKARGEPCAKGYNSSASQWLSGEQVRLCSGHPKVHFGTAVEVSWGGGGGGGGEVHSRSSELPDYLVKPDRLEDDRSHCKRMAADLQPIDVRQWANTSFANGVNAEGVKLGNSETKQFTVLFQAQYAPGNSCKNQQLWEKALMPDHTSFKAI